MNLQSTEVCLLHSMTLSLSLFGIFRCLIFRLLLELTVSTRIIKDSQKILPRGNSVFQSFMGYGLILRIDSCYVSPSHLISFHLISSHFMPSHLHPSHLMGLYDPFHPSSPTPILSAIVTMTPSTPLTAPLTHPPSTIPFPLVTFSARRPFADPDH